MRPIPQKIRQHISEDLFYKRCIHEKREKSSSCSGRISMEHSWIYAGKQINELWAIVPCCIKHNVGVSGEEKDWNRYIALLRASEEDLSKYPKKDWQQEKNRLMDIFDEIPNCLLPF